MNFQFTHPWWLLLLPAGLAWTYWLAWRSDVQISAWRRWSACGVRSVAVTLLVLALSGLQWLRTVEGLNLFFVLDRSDSITAAQQEAARVFANQAARGKRNIDRAGVLVFGADASIEHNVNTAFGLEKILAVVGTGRTDLAAAIRLGTAAFPESGQKRLVLLTDGNENLGDAMSAVLAARTLGVSIDVVPLGAARGNDVSVQKLGLPGALKKGQTFDVKIFAQADQAQPATVKLYRNDQLLGEQRVQLEAGKNLFEFPQTLTEPGFYSYDVVVEGTDDHIAQNNRASSFTTVRGDPKILLISSDPAGDASLAAALRTTQQEVVVAEINSMPATLAEMAGYDAIFLSNLAAGDLGRDLMRLLESAARDFGIGLVCVGGDQAYAAGGYRNTPLETALPVDMELSSKKVLPPGALVLVMHGMEFNNGNQISREIAIGTLEALGPQDQMGVLLWDGSERWLFTLQRVGDRKSLARQIAGMNQGDLPSFQNIMEMGYEGLKQAGAALKHMIVFSDGDPGAPSAELMQNMVNSKITVSTVLIAGHAGPETMIQIADQGRGRFYDVRDPTQLPQIFIKEAAVILKSAIFEEPFKPQIAQGSELINGISGAEIPQLQGYVATTPKARAETPLVSHNGDPILAHWQYGLGRAVAFTSDAKAKWARDWLGWDKYRQFWTQIAQWSLRRVENTDFTADVAVEKGEGHISVEALDAGGNYRNFLSLRAVVVSPRGERETVQLEQSGPGRYEARFPTRDVGAYLINLMEMRGGQLAGSQVLGASVNYSPEFNDSGPNMNLLTRIAETTGGRVLDLNNPAENPFLHDRVKTRQPRDLWEWMLRLAILLFPIDVGLRRIQLDREEMRRVWDRVRRWIPFLKPAPRKPEADAALAALLSRREQVRSTHAGPAAAPNPDLFTPVSTAPELSPAAGGTAVSKPPTQPAKAPERTEPAPPPPAGSTAGRLLEAKRRAQQRRK